MSLQNCKSCGAEMSESAAAASIFAIGFLPVAGKKRYGSRKNHRLAAKVGPLCPSCLKECKELPASDEDPA
jgi:hypothetical protein